MSPRTLCFPPGKEGAVKAKSEDEPMHRYSFRLRDERLYPGFWALLRTATGPELS